MKLIGVQKSLDICASDQPFIRHCFKKNLNLAEMSPQWKVEYAAQIFLVLISFESPGSVFS